MFEYAHYLLILVASADELQRDWQAIEYLRIICAMLMTRTSM